MAALNQNETEVLRNVQRVIELVLREGYDPKSNNERDKYFRKLLTESKRGVNTVVQMKGYYPS